MPVGSALLHRGVLPLLPLLPRAFAFTSGVLADMGQGFQTDEGVRVGVHDLPTDAVVALLLQPSLSSAHHDEASGGRASAFVLQALPQSGVVVRLRTGLGARKEGCFVVRIG